MTRSLSMLIAAATIGGAFVAAPPAKAQEYPWCAQYGTAGGGGRNCGFVSYGQCMAALWGNGGFCEPNLFFRGPEVRPQDRPYSRRRQPQRD